MLFDFLKKEKKIIKEVFGFLKKETDFLPSKLTQHQSMDQFYNKLEHYIIRLLFLG
jgi:hypothetical protein